ncbi:MAG: pyruvate, water dikinase regulatory protein [Raoultibacter sp.]
MDTQKLAHHTNTTALPTIYLISDSVGVTALALARAAASQFGVTNPCVETLSKVLSFDDIEGFLERHSAYCFETTGDDRLLVFYTLVDSVMRDAVVAYTKRHPNIVAVDLIGDAICAIAQVSGLAPSDEPGGLRVADESYFHRIAAMEFTIDHDDGRNTQDLALADIVLLGVSRSSKTPLSIYLSQQGYRVANVPLDLHSAPPKEIYEVDPTRMFGLITTPEVLVSIRKRRLGNAGVVAASYADPEEVYQDLEKARALMRKLGCIVVHTDNRAVEETAQDILRYYDLAHAQT